MTALVTKHLPLVAGAPDGIKKLRALILDLAVRGRLVPQIATEVSASELIVQMQAEQERMLSRGDIRRARKSEPVDPQGFPFEVPHSWQWVRLASIGHDLGQAEPSADFTYIDVGSVNNRTGVIQSPQVLSASEAPSRARKIVRSGSVIYSTIRPYLLNVAVIEHDFYPPAIASTAFAIIQPYPGLLARYLFWWLRSETFIKYVESVQTGIAYPAINDGQFFNGLLPLPPSEEQHRIVAKVDELMALCDRLEADQSDAEAAHAQLVQALLDSLTQAPDAADFRASWQRLSEHFHTLFTTEASIDALKQTVLQLAVMGKLVPQASDDEPAVELLSRLAKANTAQRRTSPLGDSSSSPKPYELPSGWCWTTLPEVGELARGKSKHRPRNDPALYSGGTIPLVQTGDVARANGVIYTSTGKYNATGLAQSRLWPRGTMCITIAANIADSAILGFDACFPDSVVGFIPGLPELDVRYFEYFLRTAKADLQKFAPSTAQKNINLEILGSIYLPLPPAAELTRIVAKVDELMALCDQLKAQLAEARQQHAQLATALVEQAVA